MIQIQQDQVDVIARDSIAPLVSIVYSMLDKLSEDEKKRVEKVMPYLQKWHG